MEAIYGSTATHMLEQCTPGSDKYWRLKIAEMVESPRCNIPVTDSLDLYVYDKLLPGMTSWKDYYYFIVNMIETYSN
jgi:hypothetical protein